MQLMLPVAVHTLVHEKEAHLRLMMKMQVQQGDEVHAGRASAVAVCLASVTTSPQMRWRGGDHHGRDSRGGDRPAHARHSAFPCVPMQGLRDPAYYVVQYLWHLLLYCSFVAVFCLVGGLIGLRIFTLNSYSLQASGGRVVCERRQPTHAFRPAGRWAGSIVRLWTQCLG